MACYQVLAKSKGVHTPIISSTTTRLGSSPQYGCNLAVAQVPRMVNSMMAVRVSQNTEIGVKSSVAPIHMIVASIAPAVPGPQGQ